MIYIRKDTPSSAVSQEISRVKRNFRQFTKDETENARDTFDQLDKAVIRSQLLKEQKKICAYCMSRIDQDKKTSIEHWMPISADAAKALEYNNMLLCCDGGRTNASSDAPHVLNCDAAKGDQTITISPYKKEQMDRIRYRRDGRIVVHPKDKELQYDIDHVLKLNGDIDSNGVFRGDTSTELMFSRKQAYQNCEAYISGLKKKKKATRAIIQSKIKELTDAEEYIEYVGVWLYLLRRKISGV